MQTTYPLLKVKQKYQVTIPLEVRKELNLKEGDYLEPAIENGKITLSRKEINPLPKKMGHSIKKYLGFAVGNYKTVKEIDDYINKERDAWEK